MQGRNIDADMEMRLVDTAGKGEGESNGGNNVDIDTLSCVKQIVGTTPLHKELGLALCDDLEGWEGGSTGSGYIYTYS